MISSFFFFNDTATTEIYTLSLHDALPISIEVLGSHVPLRDGPREAEKPVRQRRLAVIDVADDCERALVRLVHAADRKSTRLNSSHANISYAVFCLKKKKKPNCNNYLLHKA